jgi:hypothetical protein
VQEFTEDIAARSQAIARQLKSLKVKAVAAMLALSRNDTEEDGETANEKERSYGSMMMERLTGAPDGRIDHVLQVIKFLLYIGVLQHTGQLAHSHTPSYNPDFTALL